MSEQKTTAQERQEYLDFAKNLALEAGEIMREYFLVTETTWKSDDTPLTQADTEINSLVIERINEKYPEHSVLGEEESDMKSGRFTWVCDPVDGTTPYSTGLPVSTFSLALCDNGLVQVGVVYDPFMDRLFHAQAGGGAFCNDEKLEVGDNGLMRAIVDVGVRNVPTSFDENSLGTKFLVGLEKKGVRLVRMWSEILPTCLVGAGKFTAVIQNGKTPHDIAASGLIVQEAGGRVTDLYGNEQLYDRPTKGFIASNGVVHDELVELVKNSLSEDL